MADLNIREILGIRYTESNHWKRPRSLPRQWEALVLFCKGEVEYHFENTTLAAREGDLLILPGEEAYCGERKSETVAFFVIDFVCAEKGELTRFGAPRILAQNSLAELYVRFADFLALWERRPIGIELRAKAFLYDLLCTGLDEKQAAGDGGIIGQILDYIMEHLGDETLGVTSLCKCFFISPSQLRRNLLRATGLSPNRYILKLRLSRAENELLNTAKSIQQISYECGFASPYYFSRCFSQEYALSPREYRKKYEEG